MLNLAISVKSRISLDLKIILGHLEASHCINLSYNEPELREVTVCTPYLPIL